MTRVVKRSPTRLPAARWVARALVVGLGALALSSCTDAELERVPEPEQAAADNKLRVRGEVCTTDPDDLRFPVKVLFIIDASSSMAATDPQGARVDAMLEVMDGLREVDPDDPTQQGPFIDGVEFGVIAFGLGANIYTERCDDYQERTGCVAGFTSDVDDALAAAVNAGVGAGTTDFLIALDTAVSMLATDMSRGDEEELLNSRYVVLFLSDGIPDSDSRFDPGAVCSDGRDWLNTQDPPPGDIVEEIADRIDQMDELARRYDVRELTFNAGFVAAPGTSAPVKACGSTLIHAMASHGDGVFRDFSSGERINFLFVDFTSFKRIFALKNLVVTNLNARPFSEALYAEGNVRDPNNPTLAAGIIDSDGDGLTDELEDLVGSDRARQDTDGDGFSDLIEYNLRTSGFDALDPTDADCVADIDRADSDGDGLRDCEERFAGTNPKRYDSDLDGFGDGLEVLYGTNPAIPDGLLDVDFDGADNAREIRWHSKPTTEDVRFLSDHAYRYDVRELGLQGSRVCYSFDVSNVSLASTSGASGDDELAADAGPVPAPGLGGGAMARGENRLLLEVSEAPFDAPNEPGVARLACVSARFDAKQRLKVPANGIVDVHRLSFVEASEFDPTVDCVQPD